MEYGGFSEIQAKGSSFHEACDLLRQELDRCVGWASDDWHSSGTTSL